MGAVPKHRASHMRQGRRRRAFALKTQETVACPSCQQPILPHRACPHCGVYKTQSQK